MEVDRALKELMEKLNNETDENKKKLYLKAVEIGKRIIEIEKEFEQHLKNNQN